MARLTRIAILLLLIVLLLRRWHAIPLCGRMLWPHVLRAVVTLHTMYIISPACNLP